MVQDLYRAGEFGELQFLRGVWHNNLENHPRYWHGLPPMHYITHPLSPMLKLAGRRVAEVACFGSGDMRQELHDRLQQPLPRRDRHLPARIRTDQRQGQPGKASPLGRWPSRSPASSLRRRCRTRKPSTSGARSRASPGRPSTMTSTPSSASGRPGRAVPRAARIRSSALTPPAPTIACRANCSGSAIASRSRTWFTSSSGAALEGRESEIDVDEASAYSEPGIRAHQAAMKSIAPRG